MEREVKLIQWLFFVLRHLKISAAFLFIMYVHVKNEVPSQAVKACGKIEVKCHAFLTSVLDGSKWSASSLCHFSPGNKLPLPVE